MTRSSIGQLVDPTCHTAPFYCWVLVFGKRTGKKTLTCPVISLSQICKPGKDGDNRFNAMRRAAVVCARSVAAVAIPAILCRWSCAGIQSFLSASRACAIAHRSKPKQAMGRHHLNIDYLPRCEEQTKCIMTLSPATARAMDVSKSR